MARTLIWSFLLLLYFFRLSAQKEVPRMAIFPHKISFDVQTDQFDYRLQPNLDKAAAFSLEILQIEYNQGELIIHYKIPELRSYSDVKFINLELNLKAENGQRYEASPDELFGDFQHISIGDVREQVIVWSGLVERVRPFLGKFELVIWVSVFGKKRWICEAEKRPVFGGKQLLPHFGGLALSGGLFLASNHARTDASETSLQYLGLGTLAVNMTYFIFHFRKVKRNQAYYDKYCTGEQKPISFLPSLVWEKSASGMNLSPGFKITLDLGEK